MKKKLKKQKMLLEYTLGTVKLTHLLWAELYPLEFIRQSPSPSILECDFVCR